MDETISVIVPIYDVEDYLPKCIESILAQSYDKLEIILVNDGSTDKSGEICDKYLYLDWRIKVIHQQHRGVSAARNAGLDLAGGELIGFVDSDDYIHPRMFETLKRLIDETNADISICGYQKVIGNEVFAYQIFEDRTNTCCSNIEALEMLLSSKHPLMVILCNKLYRKELFEGVLFPEGFICEDTFVSYKILYKANKISHTEEKLYYYLQRRDSITGREMTPQRLDFFEACSEIFRFLENNDLQPLISKYIPWYLERIIYYYRSFKEINKYKPIQKELLDSYREIYCLQYNGRHTSFNKKVSLFVFYVSPLIYVKAIGVKRKLLHYKKIAAKMLILH